MSLANKKASVWSQQKILGKEAHKADQLTLTFGAVSEHYCAALNCPLKGLVFPMTVDYFHDSCPDTMSMLIN